MQIKNLRAGCLRKLKQSMKNWWDASFYFNYVPSALVAESVAWYNHHQLRTAVARHRQCWAHEHSIAQYMRRHIIPAVTSEGITKVRPKLDLGSPQKSKQNSTFIDSTFLSLGWIDLSITHMKFRTKLFKLF